MIQWKFQVNNIISVFLISLLFQNSQGSELRSKNDFCYKSNAECGPRNWKGFCNNGKEQSPIDIPTSFADTFYTTFDFNPAYYNGVVNLFYGQNNGHTLQIQLGNQTSNFFMSGKQLGCNYVFSQMHFHWGHSPSEGSEHTINGKRFPLELHLVHYLKKYASIAEARTHEDRNALHVMAILFEIGNENQALKPIISAMKSMGQITELKPFNLDLNIIDLIPATEHSFARYNGSLTTPTCDEKVIWTVFLEPAQLSLKQMKQFYKVHDDHGEKMLNYRPVQPLRGRKVHKGIAKFVENRKLFKSKY